ncbi:MAG: aldo/keto reductase [Proteobacteria bacterium]|nr:aldo/keto reductase [Pseudomonadota bacterium]
MTDLHKRSRPQSGPTRPTTLPDLSPITLGTAQFGMPYGDIVKTASLGQKICFQILDLAVSRGVHCIDTAAAYGDAEATIGAWLARRPDGKTAPRIVTKLAALGDIGAADIRVEVERRIAGSRERLGVPALDACLVHRPSDLSRPEIIDTLRRLVDNGVIGAFGVSVYNGAELETALVTEGVALVQLPHSLFDRRLSNAGLIAECASRGITVFARSVFLQGVAFLDPAAVPPKLLEMRPALARLNELAARTKLSVASLCLSVALAEPGISSIVIGVASPAELAINLDEASTSLGPGVLAETHDIASGLPETVLDPRNWN